jgi:hypothetical protein
MLKTGINTLTCYISAEDFARISGYDDIVKTISSTPVLPQWSYGMQPNEMIKIYLIY